MSIKLALLKSGETIIADIKEIVKESDEQENKEVYAYIFSNPQKVLLNTPFFVPEEKSSNESTVKISLTPWIILTEEKNIPVPVSWVVTFVEPVKSVKTMFEEQLNGKTN